MTPAEYYADEHRNLLAAANLAATVRKQHNPDCTCHEDQAITQTIPTEEME
ncbi:hypothetical protein [Arthrobacter sp. StoSoilB13]|uniref:hypothetical protein n=1 Tax=Arthrobacter sp. StoSoilB13 TaxID=2830993 RepID=UPI001CC63758|nr:hypothetical protein [Arthrobacter sp. StoSoilB13]BCW47942.1 hypothetical protein StoSoilB13_02840 [Arthrobacter sp. StoSoilB13]